jgi:hypothetical protein
MVTRTEERKLPSNELLVTWVTKQLVVGIWKSLRITVFGTYQGVHYHAQGF